MEKNRTLGAPYYSSLHQLLHCYSCTSFPPSWTTPQLWPIWGTHPTTALIHISLCAKYLYFWLWKNSCLKKKTAHQIPEPSFSLLLATAGTAREPRHGSISPGAAPQCWHQLFTWTSPRTADNADISAPRSEWTCLRGWWRIFRTMCNHHTKEPDPCTRIQRRSPQTASTILAFVVRNSWL